MEVVKSTYSSFTSCKTNILMNIISTFFSFKLKKNCRLRNFKGFNVEMVFELRNKSHDLNSNSNIYVS